MVLALPVLCTGIAVGALRTQAVHQKISYTSRASTFLKVSREPSSLMFCSLKIPAMRIQSLRGLQDLKTMEMSKGKRSSSGMKLDFMGMNIGCFISFPLDTNILLPFFSKILGYSIIVASTVAKLPQVPASSIVN